MKEFLLLLGVMLLWIGLNRWVLPWFGIQTCCCAGSACEPCETESRNPGDQDVLEPKGNQP